MNLNFIDNGTDERILKSLPVEDCPEDLVKAMNKQGLVQKDVTVQGKNGKTFTRKQWVKASDVKDSKSTSTTKDTKKDSNGRTESELAALEKYLKDGYSSSDIKGSLANMLSSGCSRMDIMASAKRAGVTWKECSHEGINWMRASMAIQKYVKSDDSTTSEKSGEVFKRDSFKYEWGGNNAYTLSNGTGLLRASKKKLYYKHEDGILIQQYKGTDGYDYKVTVEPNEKGMWEATQIEKMGKTKDEPKEKKEYAGPYKIGSIIYSNLVGGGTIPLKVLGEGEKPNCIEVECTFKGGKTSRLELSTAVNKFSHTPMKPDKSNDDGENENFGDFTARQLTQKIAKEFGGKKVEKLGDYAYVFEADYNTVKKVVEKYGLEKNHDDYNEDESKNGGFDYGADVELSNRDGQIFCTQGGFQNDDRILIGVSFNDL